MSRKTRRWLKLCLVGLGLFLGVLFLWLALGDLAAARSPAWLAGCVSTALLSGGLLGLVGVVWQQAKEIDELRSHLPGKRNSSDALRD